MLSEFNLKEKGWDLLLKDISEREGSVDPQIITTVTEVLNNVRINKDKALKEYTEKFDKVALDNMEVTDEELQKCFDKVEDEFINNLNEAKENIEFYHKAQKSRGFILNKES